MEFNVAISKPRYKSGRWAFDIITIIYFCNDGDKLYHCDWYRHCHTITKLEEIYCGHRGKIAKYKRIRYARNQSDKQGK